MSIELSNLVPSAGLAGTSDVSAKSKAPAQTGIGAPSETFSAYLKNSDGSSLEPSPQVEGRQLVQEAQGVSQEVATTGLTPQQQAIALASRQPSEITSEVTLGANNTLTVPGEGVLAEVGAAPSVGQASKTKLPKVDLEGLDLIAATPALAFVTGELQHLRPSQIPDLVAKSDFIQSAVAASDLVQFMNHPAPAIEHAAALDLPPEVLGHLQRAGISLSQPVSAKQFLNALGVDYQRVTAELEQLQGHLATDGLSVYLQRAAALRGRTPVVDAGLAPQPQSDEAHAASAAVATRIKRPEKIFPGDDLGGVVGDGSDLQRRHDDSHNTPLTQEDMNPGFVPRDVGGLKAAPGPNAAPGLNKGFDLATLSGGSNLPTPESAPLATHLSESTAGAAMAESESSVAQNLGTRATYDHSAELGQRIQLDPRSVRALEAEGVAIQNQAKPDASTPILTTSGVNSATTAPSELHSEGISIDSKPNVQANQGGTKADLAVKNPTLGIVARQTSASPAASSSLEALMQRSFSAQNVESIGEKADARSTIEPTALTALSQTFEESAGDQGLSQDQSAARTFQMAGSQGFKVRMGEIPVGQAFMADGAKPIDMQATIDQISDRAFLAVRDGGGSIKFDVKHKDLGNIELALDINQSQVDLKILAASDQARDVLAAELPNLREALRSHDLQLNQIDLGSQSGMEKRPEGQFAGQSNQDKQRSFQEFSEEASELMTRAATPLRTGAAKVADSSAWLRNQAFTRQPSAPLAGRLQVMA